MLRMARRRPLWPVPDRCPGRRPLGRDQPVGHERYLDDVAEEQLASSGQTRTAPGADTQRISAYPGEKFGLPQNGPTSVPGMGRRLLALFIDWAIWT